MDFAIPYIYSKVREFFTEEGHSTAFAFGRRQPAIQTNQGFPTANRVVWVPGDDRGACGTYAQARNPGGQPKPLLTLLEQCTVYCWAQDRTAPNDELVQYIAARSLHDAVIRALYYKIQANTILLRSTMSLSNPQWVVNKEERIYGAELKFLLTVQAMIPDEPWTEVPCAPDVDYLLVQPSV